MNIVISDEPNLSPKTRQLLDQLNQDIAALQKDAADLDAAALAIANTDSPGLTDQQLAAARAMPQRRLDLMRRELVIRQRIEDTYFPARAADRRAAAEGQRYEQVKAAVRKKLLSIGYVDGMMPGGNFYSITEDVLGRHPDVFRARQEREAAVSRLTANEDQTLNAQAIQRLREAFDRIKRQALAAVA